VEHEGRSPTHASPARRALSLALLAVQLLVFTLGAAFAGQGPPARAGSNSRALVVATSSTDGSVRAVASQDSRVEHAARARADRGDRAGGAPPLALAFLPEGLTVAPAGLTGSLDWRAFARDYRRSPSVVHGARGPPTS
jgi:hypothetical protein